MTVTFAEGDEVRLADGRVGVIDEINPNPNREEDDEYYAEFYSSQGEFSHIGEVDKPEDVVEVLRTAKELAARKIPTPEEIVRALSLLGDHDDRFDLNESDPNGEPDGEMLVYGKTTEGLPFAFRITISEVVQTDF